MSFYTGLANPDKFRWIRTMAGGLPNLPGVVKKTDAPSNPIQFRGPDLSNTIDKEKVMELLPMLNRKTNAKTSLLYISVGAQDGLITAHRDLRDLLTAQGVDFMYIEEPGYGHE